MTALPPVELPEGALLLYEHMAEDEDERDSNSRWFVRADGAFYHARNRPGELGHWSEPFPVAPALRFNAAQLDELRNAIEDADLHALARTPAARPDPEPSHVFVERWSTPGVAGPASVEVFDDEEPSGIAALRAVMNRLVADSR